LPQLTQRLDETVAELVGQGIRYFSAGAARGFDTLAALAVLRQRERNPAVRLILVLPCRDQDGRWTPEEKRAYRGLLEAADQVVCLAEAYYDGCMEARNRHLVDNSATCVAYMTRGRSGAGQTARLARAGGLTLINLAP
jgi:uncharacterized phage-like protein YoqJ